jgi:hypothetical protein
MHIIPVSPATIDIIEILNNGERPNFIEGEPKFFIFRGKDAPREIVDEDGLEDIPDEMTVAKILYADQ